MSAALLHWSILAAQLLLVPFQIEYAYNTAHNGNCYFLKRCKMKQAIVGSKNAGRKNKSLTYGVLYSAANITEN